MTTRQKLVLTSRLVSLWFFFNAGIQLLSFVREIANSRAIQRPFGHDEQNVVHMELAWFCIFALVEFAFGFLFYRAGPGVIRFLTGADPDLTEGPPAAEGTA